MAPYHDSSSRQDDVAWRKVNGMRPSKTLIESLKQASEALKKLGEHRDQLSHYNSAEALAQFIESRSIELADGTISDENLEELWLIFAPTSEWDDYVGDVNLGELIFQELSSLRTK